MPAWTTSPEPTTVAAPPPRPEDRVAAFVRLYEARAFLVYNLALRITCEAGSAAAAAEAAFVGQAAHGASEATLVPALVVTALGHAKRKPKLSGVGDRELELLRVDATLPPTERAALALSVLADLGPQDISALLRIDQAAGAELLERAMESFSLGAGVAPDAFSSCYGDWGWADPPADLWERVYPNFRRALERPAVAKAPAVAAGTPAPPRPARRRRPLMLSAAASAVVLLVAGAVSYSQRDGGASPKPTVRDLAGAAAAPLPASGPVGDSLPPASATGEDDPVAAVQSKPHKPLTAAELDTLRLKELAALRTYEKRQADKRLTQAQRDYAAKKVTALQDLAHRRVEVERREKALARRERALARQEQTAAERRREHAAQDGSEPATSPAPRQPAAQDTAPDPSDGAPTEQEAQQECVQDQDSGQYICPQ